MEKWIKYVHRTSRRELKVHSQSATWEERVGNRLIQCRLFYRVGNAENAGNRRLSRSVARSVTELSLSLSLSDTAWKKVSDSPERRILRGRKKICRKIAGGLARRKILEIREPADAASITEDTRFLSPIN